MKCDPGEFRQYVESFELSESQQDELIHTVWRVMENAVDRAWGDDPTQHVLTDKRSDVAKNASDAGPVVELEKHEYRDLSLSETFNEKKGDTPKHE